MSNDRVSCIGGCGRSMPRFQPLCGNCIHKINRQNAAQIEAQKNQDRQARQDRANKLQAKRADRESKRNIKNRRDAAKNLKKNKGKK